MSSCYFFGLAFVVAIADCMIISPISLLDTRSRVKRETNVTHLNDPKGCLLKCQNALLNDLWSTAAANETSADSNCRAQMQAFDCFDKCPLSQLKDLIRSSFEMTSLVCSEEGKKYVASYSCLQQVLPPVNKSCDEACKEYGNTSLSILGSVHYSEDFGTIYYEADPAVVTKSVDDVCKLFQCKAKCTVPTIVSKCGKAVADTSSKITKATLNQCINAYRILGIWKETPSDCKAIL